MHILLIVIVLNILLILALIRSILVILALTFSFLLIINLMHHGLSVLKTSFLFFYALLGKSTIYKGWFFYLWLRHILSQSLCICGSCLSTCISTSIRFICTKLSQVQRVLIVCEEILYLCSCFIWKVGINSIIITPIFFYELNVLDFLLRCPNRSIRSCPFSHYWFHLAFVVLHWSNWFLIFYSLYYYFLFLLANSWPWKKVF